MGRPSHRDYVGEQTRTGRGWPRLLGRIDRLVLIPGPGGEVGLGGLQEALDAGLGRGRAADGQSEGTCRAGS
jgi:hypothetical protein